MIQDKPYFMEDEAWYSHNEERFMYELTNEAPLRAIESYYYFYTPSEILNVVNLENSFKNEKEKIEDFSRYLDENFNKDDVPKILKQLVLDNMISKKYFSINDSEFDYTNNNEEIFPLYSLDYDFNILQSNDIGLETKIEEMDFNVRTHNALLSNNILTLNDLMQMDYNEIIKIKNLGRKSINEICTVLSNYCFVLKNKKLSIYWLPIPEYCKKELIQKSFNYLSDVSDLMCEEFVYNYNLSRFTLKHIIQFFVNNQIRFKDYGVFDDSNNMFHNNVNDNNNEFDLDADTPEILCKESDSIVILNFKISLFSQLIKNGLYTINDLLNVKDFTTLNGIGLSKEKEILDKLKKIVICNEVTNDNNDLLYFNEYDSISILNFSNRLLSHFIYNKIYTVKQLLSLNQRQIHSAIYIEPKYLIELLEILKKIRINLSVDTNNIVFNESKYSNINMQTASIYILDFTPNTCNLLVRKKIYCVEQLLQLDVNKIRKSITTKKIIIDEIINKITELKDNLQLDKIKNNSNLDNDVTDANIENNTDNDVTDINIENNADNDVTDINIENNADNYVKDTNIENNTDNTIIIDNNNVLIETLPLSKKAIRVLNKRKIYTVSDLLKFNKIRLSFISGLGKQDVNQILRVIDQLIDSEKNVNNVDDIKSEKNDEKYNIKDFFNQFKK